MRQGSLRPRPAAVALSVTFLFVATVALAATGGNDYYRVVVLDARNTSGVGLYTVASGPAHPVTPIGGAAPKDILVGGAAATPGQSWLTIRSYSSGTDYLQNNAVNIDPMSPPVFEYLEQYVPAGLEAVPLGDPNHPAGFVTTYRIGATAPAPDSLEVVQTVSAVGTTFNDSAVMVRTAITNTGSAPADLGVRYLWDFKIGNDDGPTFQLKGPDGPVEVEEQDYLDPNNETYEVVDDDADTLVCFAGVNPAVPFFAVGGSLHGPAALAPTPPTRAAYISWFRTSGLPASGLCAGTIVPQSELFDYTLSGENVTDCVLGCDDSAVAYWWGDQPSNALAVMPGQTVTISAYIFGYLPGTPPGFEPPGMEGPPGDPTCDDGVDNDGDGLVDLDDPDCVPPPEDEGPYGDPTCEDGVDNDGDGLVDLDDPDCAPPNDPPDCTAAGPSVEELWPPNHKLRQVEIEGVTDPDGDPVTLTITGVFQDEPLNGKGDGNTCPDAGGVGGDRLLLRSERSGQRDGRVYHVFFEAADDQGGTCTGAVSVCVPHDQGKKKARCVDQGPLFDSTGPCTAAATECLSRKSNYFGAKEAGSALLQDHQGDSLRLHPQDGLRMVFPDGTLLPVQLGGGNLVFDDVEAVVGSSDSGMKDGGFLPGKGKSLKQWGVRNSLPAEALTLSLNTGLSLIEAETTESLDLDGDGFAEPLAFRQGFPGLVVDRPGKLGDLMTVEEVLMMAEEALANGAATARGNEPLSRYVVVPAVTVQGNGKKGGKGKGGKAEKVGDLIKLVSSINSACDVPRQQPSGILRVP